MIVTQETLEKANNLNSDINNIDKVLEDKEMHKWISVRSARHTELYYSVKFQRELADWLEEKREQYQNELDDL